MPPHHSIGNYAQILTVAAMRAAEQDLIAAGATVSSLMERAGAGAGGFVHRVAAGRSVTVVCGPGNNGGDGYVIARHLFDLAVPVRVIAALPPRTSAAIAARGSFAGIVDDGIPAQPPVGDVLVDCLFGSGLTRAIGNDLFASLCAMMARHHHRIAIDLPSGIDSDSGALLNADMPAFDLTIALGAWKHAHFAMPAAALMGTLRLVDIGCAPQSGAARLLTAPELGTPAPDAHKYRRGLLAIVGGSMPGATLLASRAAQHAGAGYVTLVAERDPGAWPGATPADLVVIHDTPARVLADRRVAAALIGPGLGRDAAARARLAQVLSASVATVIDADALMLLRPGQITNPDTVLTPHEGELAALERAFGLRGDGLKRDRALRLAAASGAVVLAKGPDSVIAAPGGVLVVAPRASSWLSVAGTGDVLAGIVASRLAVHRDPLRAASEGVWLHGEAARLAGPAFAASDLAAIVHLAVRAVL